MIVPKFNKSRIARSDAIGNAIKTLATPIAKTRDTIVSKAVGAANKELIAKQRAAEKAYAKKQRSIKLQDKAAASYIRTPLKGKKGQPLTSEQKKINAARKKQSVAAQTYMSKAPKEPWEKKGFKVSVDVKGSAGRPNSKAAQKTKLPTAPKVPKATPNKSAPRKPNPVKKTAFVGKPKAPAAPGRRKNGAPK